MKAALVLGGDPPSADDLRLLDGVDRIVCADGGAAALLRAGLKPHLIVGDLDSIDPESLQAARARGVAVEKHDAAKDETDGELALAAVLAERPDSLVILGALGGSLAHTLANLRLLRRAHDAGVLAEIVSAGQRVRVAAAGQTLRLGAAGTVVNLLALDGDATVELVGTAWSGRVKLGARSARGLSNRVTATDDAGDAGSGGTAADAAGTQVGKAADAKAGNAAAEAYATVSVLEGCVLVIEERTPARRPADT